MKIGFLVARPTQFEAPFFRYVAQDRAHELHVIFSDQNAIAEVFDPEIGIRIIWGIDLLGGYRSDVLPRTGCLRWMWRTLRREQYDFLIVNGYIPIIHF